MENNQQSKEEVMEQINNQLNQDTVNNLALEIGEKASVIAALNARVKLLSQQLDHVSNLYSESQKKVAELEKELEECEDAEVEVIDN